MMQEFKGVLFDMDGVIFDSEICVIDCWKEVAKRYGIPFIEKTAMECIGTTKSKSREIMKKAYGEDFPYDEYANEASQIYHEQYDGGRLPMKNGVKKLLESLEECGIRIALATSTRYETAVNQLRDAGILDYFDEVVTGDFVEKSKPAPDIFLKACELIELDVKDVYVIEDSYNGVRAAHTGNMRVIMVPDLLPPDDEMESKAEVILENLEEVRQYLMYA